MEIRDDAMVTWQACGTYWGGGEPFFDLSLRGGEKIFDTPARGGEEIFS